MLDFLEVFWSITLQYSIWSPCPQIRGLCRHLPGIVLQRVDQKLVQVYACRVRILLAAIWNKEQDAIELSGLMTGTQGRERVCNLSEFLPTPVKFKGSSWCENTCCLAGHVRMKVRFEKMLLMVGRPWCQRRGSVHTGGGRVSNTTCSHYAEKQRGTASTWQVHPTHRDLKSLRSPDNLFC